MTSSPQPPPPAEKIARFMSNLGTIDVRLFTTQTPMRKSGAEL